jgi:class 3 adenylate cyclase
MQETSVAGHNSIAEDKEPVQRNLVRFGWLAFLASGASMISCYVIKLSGAMAPILGTTTIILNPHLQAVFMWGFALVAIIALARDRRHHGQNLPLMVGGIAFLLIIGTLYTVYDIRIETLGYVILVSAAFLNQNAILTQLNDTVQAQAEEMAAANASLEQRVDRQVEEIGRLARLKRFLAPQIADLITDEDKESVLNSHRGFIACLFCDIRNFTALSDGIEPEEVMEILQTYHRQLGQLVNQHGGTIGYRSGDGLMVILNDPIPIDNPIPVAVALAGDMMAAFEQSRTGWQKLGYDIGFGIGLASGYATLGMIGDDSRHDYTAIGNIVNLASRLCDRASDGEILINRRVFADIEASHDVTPVGMLEFKGFEKPVEVFRVENVGGADRIISKG